MFLQLWMYRRSMMYVYSNLDVYKIEMRKTEEWFSSPEGGPYFSTVIAQKEQHHIQTLVSYASFLRMLIKFQWSILLLSKQLQTFLATLNSQMAGVRLMQMGLVRFRLWSYIWSAISSEELNFYSTNHPVFTCTVPQC